MTPLSLWLLFPAGCLAFHVVQAGSSAPTSGEATDRLSDAPREELCRGTRGLSGQERRWLGAFLVRGGP
jgi:hypothetical protein